MAEPSTMAGRLQLHMTDADLVGSYSAVCMDGSPGGLYAAKPASTHNSSHLVLYIEGGGECRTARSCASWAYHAGSSAGWSRQYWSNQLVASPMDPSPLRNPDFHDWARVVLPYCSADLHSGTRRDRSQKLGGWYFSGHNLISAALEQLRRLWPGFDPTFVLVTGSSAGGIAALSHADFFSAHWPAATVKVSPAAGFFYPSASTPSDFAASRETPVDNLALIAEWQPYIHAGCAAATNNSRRLCSSAHQIVRFVRTPLFVRENLFDTAKLANCGLDVRRRLRDDEIAYLRAWARWLRSSLEGSLRNSAGGHGYYVPSCLAHASNLGFESAPVVAHVPLARAFRAWFFGNGSSAQFIMEECGDMPCSNATTEAQHCPHLSTRVCHRACQLARRRRRMRNGQGLLSMGHNVCSISDKAEEVDTSIQPHPKGHTLRARKDWHGARARRHAHRRFSTKTEVDPLVDSSSVLFSDPQARKSGDAIHFFMRHPPRVLHSSARRKSGGMNLV